THARTFHDANRRLVRGVSARFDAIESKHVESVTGHCDRRLRRETLVPVLLAETIQELELRRIVKVPESAESDEWDGVLETDRPQAATIGLERRDAAFDDGRRPFARNDFVVPEVLAYARLREEAVKLVQVRGDERPEAQPRRFNHQMSAYAFPRHASILNTVPEAPNAPTGSVNPRCAAKKMRGGIIST